MVAKVLAHYDGHTVQFYREFANKQECFAAAYEAWIERLLARLLSACGEEASWAAGMRAALVELCRFIYEEPTIARGLLLEAQVAGGAAMAERERVLGQLAAALEAGREGDDAEQAPPPLTAEFVLGGIEACACGAVAAGRGEEIWEDLPELVRFALGPYLEKEAIEAQVEAAEATVAARLRRGEPTRLGELAVPLGGLLAGG